MVQRHSDAVLRDRDRGKLDWFLTPGNPGTLVGLFYLGFQITAVVEGSDAPTTVPEEAAHKPAYVDGRAGCLQVLAPVGNGRGLFLFKADLRIVRLAASQCIPNSITHSASLLAEPSRAALCPFLPSIFVNASRIILCPGLLFFGRVTYRQQTEDADLFRDA
jgi:hypothetical protein